MQMKCEAIPELTNFRAIYGMPVSQEKYEVVTMDHWWHSHRSKSIRWHHFWSFDDFDCESTNILKCIRCDMFIMRRVCDYDIDVQIFADADATAAGIHKCMVDNMKLAPFRSGSVSRGYHFHCEIEKCFDEWMPVLTTMPLLMMISVGWQLEQLWFWFKSRL